MYIPECFAVCCLIEQHVYVPCCLASIMCIHRVALRWFLCRNQWDKKMRKHLLIDCISSNFQPLICNLYATNYFMCMLNTVKPASVAQLDAPSDWRPGGRGFNPRRGRQHSFVEIDHEIFSTVILSLPLI